MVTKEQFDNEIIKIDELIKKVEEARDALNGVILTTAKDYLLKQYKEGNLPSEEDFNETVILINDIMEQYKPKEIHTDAKDLGESW